MLNQENKIKQSPNCCTYCGKSYKIRNKLDDHVILCEIFYKAKKGQQQQQIQEEQPLPSQKKMYKMLLELAVKYNHLEEKVAEIQKNVVMKKAKPLNMIEYFNQTRKPTITLKEMEGLFDIQNEDIEYFFHNSVFDMIQRIFTKLVSHQQDLPWIACNQKKNVLFSYNTETLSWETLSHETIIKFLHRIQFHLSKALFDWKKGNQALLDDNDIKCIAYDKTISKLMTPDFKLIGTLNKYITMIYTKLKIEISGVCELES
jgi:hypothetical protein